MSPKKLGLQDEAGLLKQKNILSAIQKADVEAVKKALDLLTREELCVRDSNGRTVLHRAAQYGNVRIVNLVIEKLDGYTDLDLQDNFGKTALHYSVEKDLKIEKEHKLDNDTRAAVFHLLQAYGADIRIMDHKKKTPYGLIKSLEGKNALVMTSARQYQAEKMLGLVKKISLFDGDGQTMLHIAVKQNNIFGVKYILENYPEIDINEQRNDWGATALMYAAMAGNDKIMQILFEHPSIRYDLVDKNGFPLLFTAIQGGNESCVKKVLEKGARPSDKFQGQTAFFYAVDCGCVKIINVLLQADPSVVNLSNDDGRTALMLAVDQNKPIEVVDLLLAAGADVYAFSNGGSPIISAINLLSEGEEYLERFFRIPGFDWNISFSGNSLLWYCIQYKNINAFLKIYEHVLEVNIPDSQGYSLLDVVCVKISQQSSGEKDTNDLEVMKDLLVRKGAVSLKPYSLGDWVTVDHALLNNVDIHAVDASGRNLLHVAAFLGNLDLCKAILQLGGDRDLKDNQGLTPLQYASKRGEKEVVALLLAAPKTSLQPLPENASSWFDHMKVTFRNIQESVPVHRCDAKKRTFLHVASFLGNKEVCAFLLENGANPNFQDDQGWSPLHYAALGNQASTVWVLLCSDKTEWILPDKKGDSPFKKLITTKEQSDAAILLTALSDFRMKYTDQNKYLPALQTLFGLSINPVVNWKVIDVFLKFEDINTVVLSSAGGILFSAMQYFSTDDFKRLVAHPNIDINIRDPEDLTVLHVGAVRTNVVGKPRKYVAEMEEKITFLLGKEEFVCSTNFTLGVMQVMAEFRVDKVVKFLLEEKKVYLSESPKYRELRKGVLHYIAKQSASLLSFSLAQLKSQLSPEVFQEVLSEKNPLGETVLMVAAGALNKQSMKILIDAGVPYDDYSTEGVHLLHFLLLMPLESIEQTFNVSKEEVLDIYQALLEYFFSLPFSEPGFNKVERIAGNTPLMIAVARNNLIAVAELLKHKGLDFSIKNDNGYSVEDLLATQVVSTECRVLLEQYKMAVKKTAKKNVMLAPVGDAEAKQASPKVKLLTLEEVLLGGEPTRETLVAVLKNTDLNAKDRQGDTAVHLVIRNGFFEVLQMICSQKRQVIKFDLKNNEGDTPLHLAVRFNKLDAMKHLCVLKGQPFLVTNQAGHTPLSLAVHLGQLDMVKVLWPFTHKRDLMQLLEFSVRANKPDTVQWLAGQENINWATKNAHGETFVQIAVKLGALETLKTLKMLKADFGAKDTEGNTVVHLALMFQQYAVYQWLETEKMSSQFLKISNKKGCLPLHVAVLKGAPIEVVHLLLKQNRDALNVQDAEGNTPLHLALIAGNVETACELLANQGLNLQLLNKKGASYKAQIELLNNSVLIKAYENNMARELNFLKGAIDAENMIGLQNHNIAALSEVTRLELFEYAVQKGKVQSFVFLGKLLSPHQRKQQLAFMCQQDNIEGVAVCLSCDVTDKSQIVSKVLEQSITSGDVALFAWALSRSELDLTTTCITGGSVIAYAITAEQPEMALALIAQATPEHLALELEALRFACMRRNVTIIAGLLGTQEADLKLLLPLLVKKSIEFRDNDLLSWCVEQPETDMQNLLLATLAHAIMTGDTVLLDWTLRFERLVFNTLEFDNMPVVAYAMAWGQSEIAIRLIEQLDANTRAAKDVKGNTLLHWACYYREIRVIEALLPFVAKDKHETTGIDLNANNQFLATAYGFFIEQGLGSQYPELNQKFIALGAEVRFPQWNIANKGDEVPEVSLSRPASPAVLLSQTAGPTQSAQPARQAAQSTEPVLWVFTC